VPELGQAFLLAFALIRDANPELTRIVALSLAVSGTAAVLALAIGAPLGAGLATTRFPGRRGAIVMVNAFLGLPPVVVGLAVYLMLSRSGPLGSWGLLFTPTAMVIAQTVLATPIVIALVHRLVAGLDREYGDALRVDGASGARLRLTLLRIGQTGLVTAFLAAFGRCIAEVGAIMVVGGNIRDHTRTMTTAIALETGRGELALALALGLILIASTSLVALVALVFGRERT
jgi:tungstate transport system permease protein